MKIVSGGVYVIHSGDFLEPYQFAKVLDDFGNGLIVKVYHATYSNIPEYNPLEEWGVVVCSHAMFLAWGPPHFPKLVMTEPISEEEVQALEANRP